VTSIIGQPLSVQRQTLCAQLVAQRQVIAQQLDLPQDNDYPRSATMRFLKRSTIPAATTIGGIATLFGGVRLYKTISTVLTAVGTIRAMSNR
jgi:hypothetical protein